MDSRKRFLWPAAFVVVFSLLACNLPEMITTDSPAPAATEPPLYQQVTLTSVYYEESGSGQDYTLKTNTPLLTGSEDARLLTFNQEMAALVQQEVDDFKQNLLSLPVVPIAMGSYLEITFEQVSPPGNLLSLKFTMDFYSDGAAHPGAYSRTLTYDLEAGAFLSLGQLFLPGVDFLGPLSAFCSAELAARDIGFDMFSGGANPTADNYRNWSVAPDGLLITFDEYQVAPYAAGPQTVLVPYAQLMVIIDSDGPLAYLLP